MVFGGQGCNSRLGEHFLGPLLAQGCVGHMGYTVLVSSHFMVLLALAVQVGFNLVHGGDYLVVGNQVHQSVGVKIGNNGPDYANLIQFFPDPARLCSSWQGQCSSTRSR